jgi:hypothetical protein
VWFKYSCCYGVRNGDTQGLGTEVLILDGRLNRSESERNSLWSDYKLVPQMGPPPPSSSENAAGDPFSLQHVAVRSANTHAFKTRSSPLNVFLYQSMCSAHEKFAYVCIQKHSGRNEEHTSSSQQLTKQNIAHAFDFLRVPYPISPSVSTLQGGPLCRIFISVPCFSFSFYFTSSYH